MTIEWTHVTNRVILYGHRCCTHEIRTQGIGRRSRNVVDEAIPHGMERAGEPQTTEDYSCPFDIAPKQVMADDISQKIMSLEDRTSDAPAEAGCAD